MSRPVASDHRYVGLWVFLLASLASVGWCLWAGPSWSWDRAHYHEYAGHAWLHDLFGQGLLPSGPQVFLNPMGYVPRAMLAAAGWHEVAIAIATAAFQGLAVGFVWLAARDRSNDPAVHLSAAVLAVLTPVFLSQLGTSFIDVTTGVGVLLGVWACRRAADPQRRALAWAMLGGVAMGAAVGLKLSNAIPAALAPILFLALPRSADGRPDPVRALSTPLAYAAGGAIGALLTGGAWAATLYRRYGNPFYPAFDGLFNPAPAAAAAVADAASSPSLLERIGGVVRISGGRFVPQDAHEWLSFPWRVADPSLPASMAYLEWHAPDPRLAFAVVIALAWIAMRIVRAVRPRTETASRRPVDARLAAFTIVWCALWALSSANGRYGVAMLMLASVPMVQALVAVTRRGTIRRAALFALLTVQAIWALFMWERPDQTMGDGWDVAALRVDVPPTLRDTATLHVTTSTLSWSYLLPRLAPGSTALHLPSMCRAEPCPEDVGRARAKALLEQWAGRTRTLVAADLFEGERGGLSDVLRGSVDRQLAELDLRIVAEDCVSMPVSPMLVEAWMVGRTETGELRLPSRYAMSCAVVADPEAGARIRAERDRQDPVFNAIEHACESQLGPPQPPTHWVRDGVWYRYFPGKDIRLQIRGGRVAATRLLRSTRDLGTVDEVLNGWTPAQCAQLVWPIDDRRMRGAESPF